MVAPSKLSHIVFRTAQLETMIDWYCTLLEARIVYRNENLAFLTYDDEHHRIALVGSQAFSPKGEKPGIGFFHAAFTYPRLRDLLDTGDRLADMGIAPWRTINHGPTISFYYEDPDGNDIELQVDCFDTPEEATRLMQGESFANNPVGVLIDRHELRRKLDSGISLSELVRRPEPDDAEPNSVR